MAQAIFAKLLADRGMDGQVMSAGTGAVEGAAAATHAVQVMKEQGLDLSTHQATALTPALIDDADLILTMSESHKDVIRDMKPQAIEKTFSLKEFVGKSGDVADPFGRDVEVYRETATLLRQLLEEAIEKLPPLRQGKDENA